MKAKLFYEKSNEELNKDLAEAKGKLFNLRFEHATGQLKNGNQLAEIKKDIARIKTVVRQRELGIVEDVAAPVKKSKKAK